MLKLAGGKRNVVYTNRLARANSPGVTHDPWASHAVSYNGGGPTLITPPGGPYYWAVGTNFDLKSETNVGYASQSFGDDPAGYDPANEFWLSQSQFVIDGLTGKFGEWFNYVLRPMLTRL